MAYEDWVDREPQRHSKKPHNCLSDGAEYGWTGDGWYIMDDNGMLVGGKHPNKTKAQDHGRVVKTKIVARKAARKAEREARQAERKAREQEE